MNNSDSLERRWLQIDAASTSRDAFSRTAALANAVAALEIALTACGVPDKGRQGIQARLREIGDLDIVEMPDRTEIAAAIEHRNNAIHRASVPYPDDTHRHISSHGGFGAQHGAGGGHGFVDYGSNTRG